jgi:hypothetical protein
MLKRTSFLFAAFVALSFAFVPSPASAAKTPDRFAKADTDHDGKLSLDELNIYLITGVFESRDKNRDKKMTLKEWAVAGDEANTKLFHDRDANRDGVVALAEALAYGRKKGTARKIFAEADTNKDRFLSRAEVAAFYAKREGPPN